MREIVDPNVFIVDGYQFARFPMPIFDTLPDDELEALVHLLLQTSPGVPAIDGARKGGDWMDIFLDPTGL